MKKYGIVLGCVLAGLAGCASVPMEDATNSEMTPKIGQPSSADKAGLYIYRAGGKGGALKKDLWIDGECVGRSAPNVFFYTEVEADQEHTVSTASEFSPNHLTLQVEGGRNYFVQQYIKVGVLSGGADLKVVDEATAMKAIEKLGRAVSGNCSKPTP